MSVTPTDPRMRLEALHALAHAFAVGEFAAGALLQRVCDAVASGFGFDRVAIFRHLPEDDAIAPVAVYGTPQSTIEKIDARIPLTRVELFREVAEQGKAVFVEDARDALGPRSIELLSLRSFVVVPLLSEGRTYGFLGADRDGTTFDLSEADCELLTTIGRFTGAVLERAIQQSELRRLNELKTQFVAVASHELRTPAATIFGIARTLEQRPEALSDEQRDALLSALFTQSTRLRDLVDQLLDLSRVEAAGIDVKPRLLHVRAHVERLVAVVAAGRHDQVEVDIAPELEAPADETALDRILSNLVANALRYGKPPVIVRARVEGGLRVSVEDCGDGVPDTLVLTLFDRFTRGSPGSGEGAGLGLAIAQSYARAHGGRLEYSRGEHGGARFELVLPGDT